MKPLGRVKIEWSPDFAYAIGLLTSDGSLSKDGRHIDFTSKDRTLAISFKRCLDLDVMIGMKSSGGRDLDTCRVQFGDVLFYRWLLDFGLMPNKSKKLGVLKVPNEFFFDFLRGCFDGDGSMYAYWDPRWRSSYMYYLQLTSAARKFLIWIEETIYRSEDVRGKIGPIKGAYQLRYAKNGTRQIFNKMYYMDNIPCLKRKLVKAQRIFKIDEDHNNLSAGGGTR